MSDKILSISVACYNVEKYIEQAINSYLNCKYKDKLEILIVNDGSTDNTEKIVKKYSIKYPNIIKLLNQENAGPGSTVNTGLKNATGKYFRMIDGDDWVKSDEMDSYIEFLENNEVDMVVTNFIKVDDKTGKELYEKLNVDYEYKTIYQFDNVCDKLELNMHNVTYSTSLIKDYLKLDNCFYTDIEYLLLPIKKVKTIAFLENYIYMYRISLDTQSVNINSLQKHCDMHELVLYRLMQFYKENAKEFSKSRRYYLARRIATMVGTQMYIYLSYEASKEYKEKLRRLLKNVKKDTSDIYKFISKKKTVIALNVSNFMLYKIVSNKNRKGKF